MSVVEKTLDFSPLIAGGIVVLMLISAVLLILYRKSFKINLFWAMLAVIFSGGAMLLAAAGGRTGTIYAKPAGDPQQSVTAFFDALVTGDYSGAYALLKDHSDLGLAVEPESEAGRLIYSALRDSYHYELKGQCQINMLQASQQVSMRYLDVAAVTANLEALTEEKLKGIVQTREHDEVYDSNNQYLPAVTEEAYVAALKQALTKAKSCYTSIEFDVQLEYIGGRWLLLTAPELLLAITGGTGA